MTAVATVPVAGSGLLTGTGTTTTSIISSPGISTGKPPNIKRGEDDNPPFFINLCGTEVRVYNNDDTLWRAFAKDFDRLELIELEESRHGGILLVDATVKLDWRIENLHRDLGRNGYYIVPREIALFARRADFCFPYQTCFSTKESKSGHRGLAVLTS